MSTMQHLQYSSAFTLVFEGMQIIPTTQNSIDEFSREFGNDMTS